MLTPYRNDFNARFTAAKYQKLLLLLNERAQTKIEFRVAETPCFFSPALMERVVGTGIELTKQLVENKEYMERSVETIPPAYRVPGDEAHPHFVTVDFGLVRDEWGEMEPKLVEMQAFPSLFGFQALLSQTYMDVFELDPRLGFYLDGMDEAGYWEVMREVIVGKHDPEYVVLLEIEPEKQKTLPDFRVHEQRLGIRTVDIAKVVKQGRRLFYRHKEDRSLVPIERIYNRAIVDELVRHRIKLAFDYRDDLAVEWADNPNWYFRISKFALPYLDHPAVPPAIFLEDWYRDGARNGLPKERSRLVLKPLYSFAGKGIQFAPMAAELAAIPAAERRNYMLQERMQFEPVIRTPEGLTQAEIRILYVWPEGREMRPMISLIRMGRGLMMGVDYNRDRSWVGASAGLIPLGAR